jgi:Dolichyl-phosphate-mannose-protein mannosyltransferase
VTTVDHARRLGLLLVGAALLLGYLVSRTDVFWADGLRYIAQAKAVEHGAWGRGLVSSVDHPVYALSIAAAHRLMGGDRPVDWQRSAQVAAAAAGVLVVIPIYLIAWELLGESAAWLACILIYAVPANGHVLADALSESTFLLFFTFGLWSALRFLRAGAQRWLAPVVILSVLAYLTRPEGIVLPASLAATTIVTACFTSLRLPRRRWLGALLILVIGPLIAAGPFVLVKGGISTKPSMKRILGLAASAPPMAIERERPLDADQPAWKTTVVATKAMLRSVLGATTLPLLVLAPFGVAAGWSSASKRRHWVLLGTIVGASALAMVRLHAMAGYCTPRHAMVVAWILTIAGAAGLERLVAAIVAFLARHAGNLSKPGRLQAFVRAVVLGACLAVWAPGTVAGIDAGFGGYRLAGEWLASTALPADRILDPKGFALYYSDRHGYTFATLDQGVHDPAVRWVVAHEALIFGPLDYGKAIRQVVHDRLPVRIFPVKPVRGVSKVYVYDLAARAEATVELPDSQAAVRR